MDGKFEALSDQLTKNFETSVSSATEKDVKDLNIALHKDFGRLGRSPQIALALCALVIGGAFEGGSELARGTRSPGDAANGRATRLGLDLWRHWCKSIMLPPSWIEFPDVLLLQDGLSFQVQRRLPPTTDGNALIHSTHKKYSTSRTCLRNADL